MRRPVAALASTASVTLLALVGAGAGAADAGRPGSYAIPDVAVQPTPSFAVGADHVVAIGLDHQLYVAAGAAGLTLVGGLPADAVPKTVAAGDGFSVVVTYDGRVFGVGRNDHGQLTGAGDRATLTSMTGLPTGVLATDVVAGTAFTVVLGTDGIPYGTGRNDSGQLTGTGDRNTLTRLSGLASPGHVSQVAAGAEHTLVVSDAMAYGTGRSTEGQLGGAGFLGDLSPIGLGVPNGTVISDVAAGATTSYLLSDQGRVYAGGGNAQGQLGTGQGGNSYSFVPPVGLPAHVAAVTAGGSDVVALGDDGTAYVAGADDHGQAGGAGPATTFRALALSQHQGSPGGTTTVVRDLDGGLSGFGPLATSLTGQPFAMGGTLAVSGSGAPGTSLTANVGATTPGSVVTYTWLSDGAPLPGATGPSYRLRKEDGGHTVSLSVSFTRPGFGSPRLDSPSVAVGLANLARPRIRGSARIGERLRVNPGRWASGPVRLTVTWLRDGSPVHTGRRYVVRSKDAGHRIAVLLTATRPGFSATSVRSRGVRVREP